jgi:hypothetical protein
VKRLALVLATTAAVAVAAPAHATIVTCQGPVSVDCYDKGTYCLVWTPGSHVCHDVGTLISHHG